MRVSQVPGLGGGSFLWGVIPGGASQVATRSLAVLELRSYGTSFLAVLKLLPFGQSHLTFK
jgi:hypothetical protein